MAKISQVGRVSEHLKRPSHLPEAPEAGAKTAKVPFKVYYDEALYKETAARLKFNREKLASAEIDLQKTDLGTYAAIKLREYCSELRRLILSDQQTIDNIDDALKRGQVEKSLKRSTVDPRGAASIIS